jgi:hypothetical protein
VEQVADAVLNTYGRPVAGATVTVTTAAGASAALYAGNGTSPIVGNTLVTGADGEYRFYAPNGRYTLTIAAPGFASEARELVLQDPAEDAWILVEEFGSVDTTGVAAADAAVLAAIAYAEAANPVRGAVVLFPRGRIRLTAPILVSQRGVTLRGMGNVAEGATQAGSTQLMIDHAAGAGIRIMAADTRVESLTIGSSTARTNDAGAGTALLPNVGLHVEGPDVDSGASQMQRCRVRDVTCIAQPSHGMLFSSEVSTLTLDNAFSLYNRGHGIAFDRGLLTARTYTRPPGIVTLNNPRVQDNAGHGLAIGNPNDVDLPAYRFEVNNMESIRNGSNSALLYEPYGTFAYGQNLIFNACAFGARPTGATIGDPWTGGLAVAGRTIRINACRYINNDQPARVFEYAAAGEPTRDIEFNGMHISSEGRTPFANAVIVDAGCEQVRVKVYADARATNAQYVRPCNIDFEGFWSEESAGINADAKIIARDFSSSPQITLADDTVQVLEFTGNCGGVLVLSQANDDACNAIVAFRVGDTGFYITSLVAGANVVTGTGTLTNGTGDGTDARFNIFVASDGTRRLFLKNRRAGDRQFRITLLGVSAPRIMLSTAFG